VVVKFKARATVRGDQESRADAKLGLSPAETFAPTMRHNTFKLMTAASVARAAADAKLNKIRRETRHRQFDVTAAFLQGGNPSDDGRRRVVRPPLGFRTFDRRGVPLVWELKGNCYGRTVAPRGWHKTFHQFCVAPESQGGAGMTQSDADPCYYYKIFSDGSRFDMGVYVDDGWCVDNAGEQADELLAKFASKFQLTVTERPRHFLNMTLDVQSPTRIKITSESYVLSMADKYVPDWRSWPTQSMPATGQLTKDYEEALKREVAPTADRIKSYGGKVGALVYTSPCVRPDAAATIAKLGRALTFPTAAMESHADRAIVYLAQTAKLGITYDGNADDATVLTAQSDSDWAVGHSTSGWALFLAGAAVAYSSKRQACIAMSSTEAEIIAASAAAIEIAHFRTLLREMGMPQLQPTRLQVDNSGAVELSRDRKSCHRSRHVDRRYFKVRELQALGDLVVAHVPTADNASDLLTKPLDLAAFLKHRKALMNE
jgi:hypothetical protein